MVRPHGEGLQIAVDGDTFTLDVQEAEPGVFVARDDSGSETFHCVRDGPEIHLFWRGAAYLLVEQAEGARPRERPSGTLEAPMPGKVIKVAVKEGQAVAKGEEILVVEAMKMENALRAPRAGIVKALKAAVGATVTAGMVLAELE